MRNLKFPITQIFCPLLLLAALTGCGGRAMADHANDEITPGLRAAVKNYRSVHDFSEGLASVLRFNKYGFIDKQGNEIIPCKFDLVNEFHNGVAVVREGEKYGVIDCEGSHVVPCEYDMITPFGEDSLRVVRNGRKYGILDIKNNNIVAPLEYDMINDFHDGLAGAVVDGSCGFIDRSGKLAVPFVFSSYGFFSEGLAPVVKDGEWVYIDNKGDVVIPNIDGMSDSPFCGGVAPLVHQSLVRRQGSMALEQKAAFIDRSGKRICNYISFDFISGSNGAYVVINSDYGKISLVDSKGVHKLPGKYRIAAITDDEYITVAGDDSKFGLIEKKTGRMVIPCEYETADFRFSEWLTPAQRNGKYGYLNKRNEVVIPFIYDKASPFSDHLAVVVKDGKYGYVDRYGNDTFD